MPLEPTTQYVSTNHVAKALGVSVSTVKRWVDEGVLPAHKTAGGHRKLLVADVMELARRGEMPHSDLSLLMIRDRRAPLRNVADLASSLYRALVYGDAERVRTILHGAYRAGNSIEELADIAIGPAMRQIGQDWASGKIDVMEEHRATQLCEAALYELKSILEDRALKDRPIAVGAAAEGDYSVLPTLVVQMVLLDAGWNAISLGPNTPFPSLERAVVELKPRLMWVSVSHLNSPDEFIARYRAFYQTAEKAGVAVAIGGRALVESVRSCIPYTTYGDGMTQLASFARKLNPRPCRPRRGRPRNA
jgi:MerR family transcriptional regulator, light-induced transcriptional regulator